MMMMTAVAARRVDAVLEGLRAEFGGIVAGRILEAEALDFLWEARISERYLGQFHDDFWGSDDPGEELSRIAILSLLDGHWHAALCLVDGDGQPCELLWQRVCDARCEAEETYWRTR